MQETNLYEKALSSLINAVIVIILFLPFFALNINILTKKLILVVLFLLYNLFFLVFSKNRCLGMIIMKTHWKKEYAFINQIIYLILYTLSFATLIIWIVFPFDLFLFNMLFLQLPMILLKGTTFHGYLAGNMISVKNTIKSS